ncbi:MAG: GxxExxY protein [Phycisphaerales bacterium JB063]
MSREPSEELDSLAHRVIGAAIAVHRVLGPGHLESVYEKAMCVELTGLGIKYVAQHRFQVNYEGVDVGESRVDLLVENALVVELKAIEQFAPIHSAQVLAYLKGLNLHLGLLINFNVMLLKNGMKRIINPTF